ncbi:LuxR C-terminal-related transcriptional regulator [Streptomyces sp. NPDC096205]|uniref:helix-turn-helix transcriptional regulator n=1 Tax=Streptomyces sp. NPDC096205 TaxID=3366081 RepID=UPI00382D459B
MPAEGHTHAEDELCEPGRELYARALRDGSVSGVEIDAAPCLLELGLLQATVTDPDRFEPLSPAFALHRLLRASEDRVAEERRHSERLAEAFAPLLTLPTPAVSAESKGIRLLSGLDRINLIVGQTLNESSHEALTIQPHTSHVGKSPNVHAMALDRDQAFLDRGGRMKTLYQHTTRHVPTVMARFEQLKGRLEARALDEVTERLMIFDRRVAFIPANRDRSLALEIHHPAVVGFLATTFDRLWRLATPMYPEAVRRPTLNGVTPRQRAIAALLIEGHTDAVIAERLGMNVRTTRVHIAKLAATLGSESRTQLGYLIGESGILKGEG